MQTNSYKANLRVRIPLIVAAMNGKNNKNYIIFYIISNGARTLHVNMMFLDFSFFFNFEKINCFKRIIVIEKKNVHTYTHI